MRTAKQGGEVKIIPFNRQVGRKAGIIKVVRFCLRINALMAWTVLFPIAGLSQGDKVGVMENFLSDTTFFWTQQKVYQRWLEHTGLAKVLATDTIVVEPDRVSLYLAFPTEDADSVFHLWNRLKKDFEEKSPLTLEQQLFYKMIDLMEIGQEKGNVQLYNTYNLDSIPCFFLDIHYKEDVLKTDTSLCKDEIREIFIPAIRLNNPREPVTVHISKDNQTRRQIFDSILAFSRRRFEVTDCPERPPRLREREHGERLRFEADDLCRVVLYDETNNLACRIFQRLGFQNCNTIRRERLMFTITVKREPEGFRVLCQIDGKYCPGLAPAGRSDYKPMEGEFDDYLELFADMFSTELQKWFEK